MWSPGSWNINQQPFGKESALSLLSLTLLHLQRLNLTFTQTAADKLEGGQGQGDRETGRSSLRAVGQRGENSDRTTSYPRNRSIRIPAEQVCAVPTVQLTLFLDG